MDFPILFCFTLSIDILAPKVTPPLQLGDDCLLKGRLYIP